ncbi:phage baseplate assembly protein V [Paraburkholderia sp. BR14263]|uniref:phage baseplate assembly protein V n=1 Tax=unclassified Paraburkholderia TaxID=2615204 RepID=UPI0034CE4413
MGKNNHAATGGVLFKTGVVFDVGDDGRVRVRFDDIGLTSHWLTVCYPKTNQDKFYWPLDVGDQVRCIMDQYLEDGAVLGAIYSEVDAVPWASKDQVGMTLRDGGSFTYDRSTGTASVLTIGDLSATVGGALKATVTGDAVVKASHIELDAEETVIGGNLRVKGATMLEGGVGGAPGAGTPIPGDVVAENDVVAGDISVRGHHHDDPQGGETSEAKA